MNNQKAVALSYEAGKDSAPRVVAKGQNELAMRIIAKAKAFDVPLFANALDSHIPSEMYNAVVEVFVWLLKCEREAQLSKDISQ